MAKRPKFYSFSTPQRDFYDQLMDYQESGDWGAPKPNPKDFPADDAERRLMEELLRRLFGRRGGAALQPPPVDPVDPGTAGEGRKKLDEGWTYS